MTAPELVYQGSGGERHFLFSSDSYSVLVITDPAVGVQKFEFGGRCRLMDSGRYSGFNGQGRGAEYASYLYIGAEGSQRIDVTPGREAFADGIGGVCYDCVFEFRGHDYGLWPVCPNEGRQPAPEPVFEPVSVPEDGHASREERFRANEERKAEPVAEPVPEPEPEPVPEVPAVSRGVEVASEARTEVGSSAAVQSTARTLAVQVRQSGVKRKADYFTVGTPPGSVENWIAHAVNMGWVVEDGDLLRPGPVSPYLPEPTAEAGRSDHWTHRFLSRTS